MLHKVDIDLLKLRHKTLVKFVEFQAHKLLSGQVHEMIVSNETQNPSWPLFESMQHYIIWYWQLYVKPLWVFFPDAKGVSGCNKLM